MKRKPKFKTAKSPPAVLDRRLGVERARRGCLRTAGTHRHRLLRSRLLLLRADPRLNPTGLRPPERTGPARIFRASCRPATMRPGNVPHRGPEMLMALFCFTIALGADLPQGFLI